jgi:NAD(P)-dependent dehydrogenase (short-subunit alcohol dehydrogenase family)
MSNPVVLVTGALTGIGRATAVAFARNGSRIVVSGRHEDKGQALAGELRTLGAEAEFIRADVRNESEVRNLIDRTVERFGRLDVAVNNAGTEGELGPIVEQSVANYEATFGVNVLGTLLSLKHEMRVMLAQGSGSIINLSSIGGQVGFAGAAIYVASKHAVEGLTKSAALEGARAGVRVNAVAPGPTETQMLDRFVGQSDDAKARFVATIPSGRASTPDEIAATIVFLAGDSARSLTGQRIAIDGAYTAQ